MKKFSLALLAAVVSLVAAAQSQAAITVPAGMTGDALVTSGLDILGPYVVPILTLTAILAIMAFVIRRVKGGAKGRG